MVVDQLVKQRGDIMRYILNAEGSWGFFSLNSRSACALNAPPEFISVIVVYLLIPSQKCA